MMVSSKALDVMLKGTGYTYRFDTDNSVDIIPADEPNGGGIPAATTVMREPATASREPTVDQYGGRLEQVNVTGSLIRGVQDTVAPLIYLKQQQLAMTDYATVQDSLYSQPIISLNGPREDLGIDANYQFGAGLDLRGLGVGATLVLVNGERQPLSGLNGDFVDVSTIPLSAVRSASKCCRTALQRSTDLTPSPASSTSSCGITSTAHSRSLRYGTAIGGRREMVASQLLGTHWTGGHAMLAYEYSG